MQKDDAPTRWMLQTCHYSEVKKHEMEKLYELTSEQLVDHILMNKPDSTAGEIMSSLANIGRWGLKHIDGNQNKSKEKVHEAALELAEILENAGLAQSLDESATKLDMKSSGVAVMIIYERGPWEIIRLLRDYLLPMCDQEKH